MVTPAEITAEVSRVSEPSRLLLPEMGDAEVPVVLLTGPGAPGE